MNDTSNIPEDASPRALIVARSLALEVGLGALGGALGVLVLAPVFLRAPDLSSAIRAIAGLTLWCALLAVVVRVARAGRRRVRPAITVALLALPAIWLAGPVALATTFAGPPTGSGTDPFRAWEAALEAFRESLTPQTLAFSLAWGALVPFVLVGACRASRPRTPTLWLALLGAAAGYLGLTLAFSLLRRAGLDLLLFGARQAFLCGIPCAVAAMALAPRLPRAIELAAEIEEADRRAWRRLGLSTLAVLALIGAGALGHVRHVFDALIHTQGWSSPRFADVFGQDVWRERLDDPRQNVKLVSMSALATFGAAGSRATPTLLRSATQSASAMVRWSAIDTISAVCVDGIRYEATLPTMLELALKDPHPTVRSHAARLLIAMGDPAAPKAFFEALASTSTPTPVRRAAFLALQGWWAAHPRDERSPSSRTLADALLRAYADPAFADTQEPQRELYGVFIGLTDVDVVEHLGGALTDPDPRVRRLAALTLRGPLSYAKWRLTPAQRQLLDATD